MLRASSIATILSARGLDTIITNRGLCVIRGKDSTLALANVTENEAKETLAENPQFTRCEIYNIPVEKFRQSPEGLYSTPATRRTPSEEYYQNGTQRVYIEDVDKTTEIASEPIEEQRPDTWISASMTRQHLLKDPVVDYFARSTKKRKRSDSIEKEPVVATERSGSWLMERGNQFEATVMEVLYDKFPGQIRTVGTGHGDSSSVKLYHDTIAAMREGVPIIYQGVLHDAEHETIGSPDLLVRTDFLYKLVKHPPPIEALESIFGDYGYCVVDIKWSSLKFRANGVNLLTTGSTPAFKGQCWVYNQALGQMQGVYSRYSYILGRGWTWTCKGETHRGTNSLSRLGVIDFHTVDAEYATKTISAIKWRKRLHEHGDTFKAGDPEFPELFPNMSIHSSDHAKKKQKLADKIGEITAVWQCGIKERILAHTKGVYSWRDPRFGPELIEWSNPIRSQILNKILTVNRGDANWFIGSHFPLKNPPKNTTEVFIDFETLKSICTEPARVDNTVMNPSGEMVFMVGIGHVVNGQWIYRGFVAENRTHRAEYEMFRDVHRYLTTLGRYVAYHWSSAEPRMLSSAVKRSPRLADYPIIFEDLLPPVREAPLTVKGALDFSVKSIGRALYELGEVQTAWAPEDSGLRVMIEGMKAYKTENPREALLHVLRYNEVDCKIMWEILSFLRRNL